VDRVKILQAELVGTERSVTQTGFFHGNSSSRLRPLASAGNSRTPHWRSLDGDSPRPTGATFSRDRVGCQDYSRS
jgi:hypothetical protein